MSETSPQFVTEVKELVPQFVPEIKELADTYNETPYESESFFFTKPSYLQSVALLFGLQGTELENAKILEIGCAGGMNLVQFASEYPKSYTLGIDISSEHIKQANQLVQDLKLTNIEFKTLSISDLDTETKFDYIICHGVFSWVPEEIRDAILKKTKELLSPRGVAFISYNTLPGWNMVTTIRDMQLFHSEIFTSYKDKLAQGKLFLKFITDSLGNVNNSYINFLKEETANLDNKNDSYIRHEYFENHNNPFYFKDFIAMAKKYNLMYLSEAMISNMYLGNMPTNMQQQLSTIKDIIRLEQYMDFIVNRRFRCTILCHDNVKINRNLSTDTLEQFSFAWRLKTEQTPNNIDFSNNDEVINYYNFNSIPNQNPSILSTKHSTAKVLLAVLEENMGNPLTKADIIDLSYKKFPNITKAEYLKEFNNSMLALMFGGHVQYFATKPQNKANISKKPKVSDLTIYRAKQALAKGKSSFNITNQINEAFNCMSYQIPIIISMNGKNTIEQIKEIFINAIKSREIKAEQNGQPITDEEALKALSSTTVNNLLELFRKFYILI